MHANASDGFIAGCMSDRYISVVTRATSFALYMSWICWQRSRRPDALVLRLLRDELRQDPPQRLVLVVVVLELLQRGHQRVPAALGDADREHDEERVEARLLDDDAVLGQEPGDDRRRNPGLRELARHVEPGLMIVALIGSRMLKPVREIAEAVPFLVRAQQPVVALAHALGRQALRSPDLEPPVLAPLVVDLAHRAAEVERLDDRLLDQRRAARAAPSSPPTRRRTR